MEAAYRARQGDSSLSCVTYFYVMCLPFSSFPTTMSTTPSPPLRSGTSPDSGRIGSFDMNVVSNSSVQNPHILAPHQRRHLPDHPEISNLTKMGRADAGLTPNTEADSNHLI